MFTFLLRRLRRRALYRAWRRGELEFAGALGQSSSVLGATARPAPPVPASQ